MNESKLAATLAIALLPSLASATTFQGNLVLASQSDVNAASVYTVVTGSLTISGGDIVDLGPLAGLTQVGEYISMSGNPSLTQVIGGFPSLTGVGGGLFFYNNDSLLEFSGFDALPQTGDNIDFWFNDVLTKVTGFQALHTAGWSLEFGGNPNLVEIPEFSSLQTIKSSLFILDNPKLGAITGFQALQFVSWSFQIQNNASLNDLCGLYAYFTVNNPYTGGGAFDIKSNGPGLPNPTTEQDVINAGPCLLAPYGSGCPGTGGVTPTLAITGQPAPGQQVAFTVAQGLGGASSYLAVGAGQASLAMGGGCTLNAAPLLAFVGPIPLGGVGAGAGSVALPAPLPAGTSGLTTTFQAFVSDPGGAFGFSNSNGFQMTIQ